MDLHIFHAVLDKYLAGTATPNEQKLVEAYWERFSSENTTTLTDADRQLISHMIHAGVTKGIQHAPVIPLYKKRSFRIAAAILLICLAGAAYYSIFRPSATSETHAVVFQNDIHPINEGATLTLADGKMIQLDRSVNGTLTGDKGINITKKDGNIIYSSAASGKEILFNTLSTARGRNYHIKLSDGTEVWLDAMSSIKYPAVFIGKERVVEITGQVYFEVMKNGEKPFTVKVLDQNDDALAIKVLGTSFNVNSYLTPVTTLLEGSVKLEAHNRSVIMKPLQQSVFHEGSFSTSESINTDVVMAWRNNQFRFDGSTIKEIMTEISRWYNVEVIYKDNISEKFVAKISRDVPLSKLLGLLEMTNQVKFDIEGNKVTIVKP